MKKQGGGGGIGDKGITNLKKETGINF